MSEPTNRTEMPRWLAGAIVILLTLQLGLLWMQGTLLERQHGDLQGLRQDVQDLAESLDQFEGAFDQGANDGTVRPSRYRRPPPRRAAVRVLLQEPDGDRQGRKDLEDARKSAQEAVAKARDVREKLSWDENARKAEEKAKIDRETHKIRNYVSIGAAVGLLALILRAWLRNRG